MSMLMMDKKRNPAVMIVAKLSGKHENPEGTEKEESELDSSHEHLKLAMFEFASKAGIEVENISELVESYCSLHRAVHEYEEATQDGPDLEESDSLDRKEGY